MAHRADNAGWFRDGNLSFSGVDSNTPADQLTRTQCQRAVNTTFRTGIAANRPAWRKRALTFSFAEVQTAFESAYFQEAFFYGSNGVGNPALLSSHSGRQFRLDVGSKMVTEITPLKSYSTVITVAGFIVPIVGGLVSPNVADSSHLTLQQPIITIAGYTLTLTAINSATNITVKNLDAAQSGAVVANGSTVRFSGLDVNDPDLKLNWSVQAENYWILQDNQSYPIIYDGASAARANPAKYQVPIGNVMCYAQGRLLVALNDRQSYMAGDIFGGASGTAANQGRDAILYFTENRYLNEGGEFIARVFGAPSNSGPILSMKACAQTDAQLGQGSVLIGTPNVVFSVNLPYDRTIWKNLANALQTANPIIGPTGQNSTVMKNTDMWYRSLDGVRSYIMAQRQFNGSWGNSPMSVEMEEILKDDTKLWLEWGSAVDFDNRMLFTVSPQQSAYGIWHRGLAVIDFNLASSLGRSASPAWEGIWTGLKILRVLTGLVNNEPRCYLYVLSAANKIELWELTTDEQFDNGTDRITWWQDLPSYNCGNTDAFKKLKAGRLILTNLSGTVNGTVQYAADESSCWNDWATFVRCAKNQDCGPFTCAGPITYQPQTRYPVRLAEPPDEADSITKRFKNTGYEFAVRLTLVGSCAVKQFRLFALPADENLGIDDASAEETASPCDKGVACASCSGVFQV